MEAVRAFNNELSSLYEAKPPVSRAKMASVTKSAIKAIKFYKHVVQSVEKFIMKCKAEYKIPGLYVIDSVVRQSRHQFGPDKDVFGPRFTKNIVTTFQCLLKCPPEEKCRVVRVLNLWQKNAVFPVDLIQPLLDLAADPTSTDSVLAAQRAVEKVVAAHQRAQGKPTNGGAEASLLAQQTDIVNTVTRLLQQTGEGSLLAQGQEVQLQQLQLLQQQLVMHTEMMSSKPQQTPPVIDNNLLAQIKLLTDQLLNKTDPAPPPSAPLPPPSHHYQPGPHPPPDEGRRDTSGEVKKMEPGFNRKLLDFDYGDSDDEEDREDNSHHIVGGVQKLLNDPNMMMHIHNVATIKPGMSESERMHHHIHNVSGIKSGMSESERMHHLEQQQEQFNKEIGQSQFYNKESDIIVVEEEQEDKDRNYDRDRRRSRRSRDRSRSPKRRKHSRSRSRERRRSRERDRHRRSRSEEEERERQRERERERKKNGFPPVQEKYMSLCSTTLWFGHLAKHTTEDELHTEIQKYGTITNIKMVPPRGCAFVTMTQRRDAAKALDRLKGFKLNYSALKVAWAPNIGIKDSPFQDLFDKELGVTYIAWNKLPADIGPLLEGAVLDEESLPEHLKGVSFSRSQEEGNNDRGGTPQHDNHPMPYKSQLPPFGARQDKTVQNPSMSMPPPMMMPPTGMPPPNMGQIPLPAGLMPSNPSQGMPPHMPPTGGPPNTSMPQGVPANTSLLGAVPTMSNSPHSMGMDGQMTRPPGLPHSTAASLIMSGHQPGIMSRPGFPPPGNPFGMPNMRPSFPGMGMRPPAPEMEDLKEWSNDDKLEEEALAEMEDDEDEDLGRRPRQQQQQQHQHQHQHNAPPPMIPMPMGMRMGFPGHMGPRGLAMQLRPHGMMMGPSVSNPGMMGLARPGMLGPRIMQAGGPQDPGDGMMRPGLHQGMMGMRLNMGSPQGPRTQLNPGNMPMGQRHGVPSGAGMRGMMPGGSGIRIVLGPRPNLVRPGGPFSMGDVPTSQGEGAMGDMSQGVPPAGGSQGPGLLPPGMMMGAALRGGRPGLLGPRPNLPVNGGFRFGPGPLGFMGPRPDMMRGPSLEPPPMEGLPGMMPAPVAGAIVGGGEDGEDKSPEYGESSSSPVYGEDCVSSQEGPAGTPDADLRTDAALLSQDLDSRASSAGAGEPEIVKSKRTRWSSGDKNRTNTVLHAAALAEANGPSSGIFPHMDALAAEAAAAPNPNQIQEVSDT